MYSNQLRAGSGSGRSELLGSDSDLANLLAQDFQHVKSSKNAAYD